MALCAHSARFSAATRRLRHVSFSFRKPSNCFLSTSSCDCRAAPWGTITINISACGGESQSSYLRLRLLQLLQVPFLECRRLFRPTRLSQSIYQCFLRGGSLVEGLGIVLVTLLRPGSCDIEHAFDWWLVAKGATATLLIRLSSSTAWSHAVWLGEHANGLDELGDSWIVSATSTSKD